MNNKKKMIKIGFNLEDVTSQQCVILITAINNNNNINNAIIMMTIKINNYNFEKNIKRQFVFNFFY